MTFATFRQIADHCASLSDAASCASARSRLEQERDDWLQLAQGAGLTRSWAIVRKRLNAEAVALPRP